MRSCPGDKIPLIPLKNLRWDRHPFLFPPGEGRSILTKVQLLLLLKLFLPLFLLRLFVILISASSGCCGPRLDPNTCQRFLPDTMPERMSEYMPDGMPERMTEYRCQLECQKECQIEYKKYMSGWGSLKVKCFSMSRDIYMVIYTHIYNLDNCVLFSWKGIIYKTYEIYIYIIYIYVCMYMIGKPSYHV